MRESLARHIPSAGVGTALSRRALQVISDAGRTKPFDTTNLTEDYHLALRLNQDKLKLIFARFKAGPRDIIATREFFPDTLGAVVRQKSRWLIGIAFQGWRHQKWRGPLSLKYVLFRDRKGIFTAQLSIAAYFILFNILAVWLVEWFFPAGYHYPPLVREGEPIVTLLWANLLFLINRALNRIYFTSQVYGIRTGLLSLPRQLWGNILNFLAANRAIWIYSGHLLFGTALVWEKTDHMFPDTAQLHPYRKKLGELLIHNRVLSADTLQAALALQKTRGAKLGQILLQEGHITDLQLTEQLTLQERLYEHQN